MKLKKKAGLIQESPIFLIILILVAVVVIMTFGPMIEKLKAASLETGAEEGCELRGYYPVEIKKLYESPEREKGIELYNKFQRCYPKENLTGVSENIRNYYETAQTK